MTSPAPSASVSDEQLDTLSSQLDAASPSMTSAPNGSEGDGSGGGLYPVAVARGTPRRKRRPRPRVEPPPVGAGGPDGAVGVASSGTPTQTLDYCIQTGGGEAARNSGAAASGGRMSAHVTAKPSNSNNTLVCAVCGDEAIGCALSPIELQ